MLVELMRGRRTLTIRLDCWYYLLQLAWNGGWRPIHPIEQTGQAQPEPRPAHTIIWGEHPWDIHADDAREMTAILTQYLHTLREGRPANPPCDQDIAFELSRALKEAVASGLAGTIDGAKLLVNAGAAMLVARRTIYDGMVELRGQSALAGECADGYVEAPLDFFAGKKLFLEEFIDFCDNGAFRVG